MKYLIKEIQRERKTCYFSPLNKYKYQCNEEYTCQNNHNDNPSDIQVFIFPINNTWKERERKKKKRCCTWDALSEAQSGI